MESIFSQIIAGKMHGVEVCRDEHSIVLMDAFPMLPGHVLVIPLQQHIRIRDLPDITRAHLLEMAVHLTQVMSQTGLSCGDANIVINDGRYSGQSVAHVHIHVVPRNKSDGFPFPALFFNLVRKLTRKKASVKELEKIAAVIGEALNQSQASSH